MNVKITTVDHLREILGNLHHEGQGNGYIHTHWRVHHSEGVLYSEEVCINQFGSTYGIGRYASLRCELCPTILNDFYFTDIEV